MEFHLADRVILFLFPFLLSKTKFIGSGPQTSVRWHGVGLGMREVSDLIPGTKTMGKCYIQKEGF